MRTTAVATLFLVLASTGASSAQAPQAPLAPAADDAEADAAGRTPPRLGFVDGQVSFWRPGAEEWTAARLNTALAEGDQLYTGSPGNLEIQIGGRAYVRAWANTQLGLTNLEPDFVQVKVATGYVALDLRRLDPGQTIEVDTPNAAFTIDRPGYYRLTVADSRTSFVTRRGGRATVTPANGAAATVAPSEEAIVEGVDRAQVATYVAPEPDIWDRWNYARTDALIDSVSGRYVPTDVYGVDDLDQHGSWRVVETYGSVWMPTSVPAGWAPYSTGSWMWDPHYGWTWVDAAPWGWAPYHYGRWVFVGGFWAWAPGPVVVRPIYAPALVAFFGPRAGIGVAVAGPTVGWVALGWGEPIIPWWGPVRFVGVPRWVGWGGPRFVNNVVISRTTIVHAREINIYRNVAAPHGVVVVPRDRFGHGPVTRARLTADAGHLAPLHGKLDVAPSRASLSPGAVRAARPPEATFRRPVVATRPPGDPARRLQGSGIPASATSPETSPRIVPAPTRGNHGDDPPRPPFGASKMERQRSAPPPRPERAQPSPSNGQGAPAPKVSRGATSEPRVQPRPAPSSAQPAPPATQPAQSAPVTREPNLSRPAPPSRFDRGPSPHSQSPAMRQAPRPEVRALPGEPASRLFPERAPGNSGRAQAPSVRAPGAAPPAQAPGRPSHPEKSERRAASHQERNGHSR